MVDKKYEFNDDKSLAQSHTQHEKSDDLNQFSELADKWNVIQEEYVNRYPALETADLYYESGGFHGVLKKIAEVRGISVGKVRKEIENW